MTHGRDDRSAGTAHGATWRGRVFGRGATGGNHTVVVPPGQPVTDPAAAAALLGVPDTAFVTAAADGDVVLRTFSPVEELAQCLQTSLAVLTALDAPDRAPWRVRHERGEQLVVHREGPVTWARHEDAGALELEEAGWPDFVRADPADSAPPVITRQSRSRLHLRCADAAQLMAATVEAEAVLELCARTRTSGLVLSAPDSAGEWRVRVFTTSLSGAEDNATGGAVLGLGALAALDGFRGDVRVCQGPRDPARQGHLLLRVQDDGAVLLGGEVTPLLSGRLMLP
ncbi:PhzF family phenazine biosynthesis protein [Streptomyces sp. AV19]|uniref:PhzF family phenazine biosynthesis protein n=1 Tax=Streptomyces sp. AV19 TaxID=2793068 RepID=UPI0018FE06DD|nr:PhzF family phenazine biosynthesis protein [Streptomyces sp. AV19]MBH1934149.1 PhzF family phenazine biosynthesis protein [Streptomyces sp. AV19]MDG4533674.1 PhzF family phenazine biosynthesis protein [Streptomyces sp. AV19]